MYNEMKSSYGKNSKFSQRPYLYTFKEPRNRFRQPMQPGGPVRQIGLSCLPTRLGIELWAPKKVYKYGLRNKRKNSRIKNCLPQQVLRNFFFEFWSDCSVCFPLRHMDMRSERIFFCLYRKYAFQMRPDLSVQYSQGYVSPTFLILRNLT